MSLEAVDAAEVPDLLPARMLNEYTYCPRLFFLEWVQQQWADNADTAEGDPVGGRPIVSGAERSGLHCDA
ncbi:MAG TPA: hypothetical protein VGA36_06005 [Nitriliruptorales bacterium]